MNIKFLGTGSAFTLKNYHSNFIIESDSGKKLLFDCGSDIRFSLNENGLSYKDIDAIFISHLHADHAGGIEYMAFCSYFDPNCPKPKIISAKNIINDGWNNVWSGGLKLIQNKNMNINDYFNIHIVDKKFLWEDVEFKLIPNVHITEYIDFYFSNQIRMSIIPSYGLFFGNNKKVYITSDSQFMNIERTMNVYKDADIIIQDCETLPFNSGVHANYNELKNLDDDIKKKMILVHYQDNVIENFEEWSNKSISDGFNNGFVINGSEIEIDEYLA